MRYAKIEINGKESLPTKSGRYIFGWDKNKSTINFGVAWEDFDPQDDPVTLADLCEGYDWYLQPLPQTEISDEAIYQWLKDQKYQTEYGEQEYTMYYSVDMPKILRAFLRSQLSRIETEKVNVRPIERNMAVIYENYIRDNNIQGEQLTVLHKLYAEIYSAVSLFAWQKPVIKGKYIGKEQPVSEPESIKEESDFKICDFCKHKIWDFHCALTGDSIMANHTCKEYASQFKSEGK
jgi:hypothetical protein